MDTKAHVTQQTLGQLISLLLVYEPVIHRHHLVKKKPTKAPFGGTCVSLFIGELYLAAGYLFCKDAQ